MSLRTVLIQAGAHAIADDRAEELDEWHFEDAAAALHGIVGAIDSHLAHRLTPEFEGDERTGVFRLLEVMEATE